MTGWESGSRDCSFTKPRLLGLRISAQTWKRIHQEGNYPISLFSEVSGEKLMRTRLQKITSCETCVFPFPISIRFSFGCQLFRFLSRTVDSFTWYPCWIISELPASFIAVGTNCICISGCDTLGSLLTNPPLSKWLEAHTPFLNKNHCRPARIMLCSLNVLFNVTCLRLSCCVRSHKNYFQSR